MALEWESQAIKFYSYTGNMGSWVWTDEVTCMISPAAVNFVTNLALHLALWYMEHFQSRLRDSGFSFEFGVYVFSL